MPPASALRVASRLTVRARDASTARDAATAAPSMTTANSRATGRFTALILSCPPPGVNKSPPQRSCDAAQGRGLRRGDQLLSVCDELRRRVDLRPARGPLGAHERFDRRDVVRRAAGVLDLGDLDPADALLALEVL